MLAGGAFLAATFAFSLVRYVLNYNKKENVSRRKVRRTHQQPSCRAAVRDIRMRAMRRSARRRGERVRVRSC